MKTKSKKQPTVKAREQFDSLLDDDGCRWQPIWTIPRTAAGYDRMVEQGARAIHEYMEKQVASILPKARATTWAELKERPKSATELRTEQAISALSAIGITRPTQ